MKIFFWAAVVILTLMALPEALLRVISPNTFRQFAEMLHHSPNFKRWRLGAIGYMVLAGIMLVTYRLFPVIWHYYLAIIGFWSLWVLIDWATFHSYQWAGIMMQLLYLLALSLCFYFLPQITWVSFILVVFFFGLRGFMQIESIPTNAAIEMSKTNETLRKESFFVMIFLGAVFGLVYFFSR